MLKGGTEKELPHPILVKFSTNKGKSIRNFEKRSSSTRHGRSWRYTYRKMLVANRRFAT